ncbi:MAG TPA: hypothetical protein VGC09_23350 [Rhodopila sp.]
MAGDAIVDHVRVGHVMAGYITWRILSDGATRAGAGPTLTAPADGDSHLVATLRRRWRIAKPAEAHADTPPRLRRTPSR